MIIVNKGADYSALGLGRAFIPEDQISNEVKTIMAHYSDSDIVKMSALQEFFDSIGSTLKAKLRNMILPIFASNLDEALYDIIQDGTLSPVSGSNRLAFSDSSKRLRATGSDSAWPRLFYEMNDVSAAYTGNLVVASNNIVSNCTYFGADISLNDGAVSPWVPVTTNNKKIIGAGVVSDNGNLSLIRLADLSEGDRITAQAIKPSWWGTQAPFFGKVAENNETIGTRIFVSSQELLTVQEAKTLRDAVKALDDKFFG